MRAIVATLTMTALFIAACSEQPAERSAAGQATTNDEREPARAAGPPGPPGPPGPAGSPGAPGPPGISVRFAESTCETARCTISCDEGERMLNAYAHGSTGSLVYQDDRTVVYRPTRRGQSAKIVLACVKA